MSSTILDLEWPMRWYITNLCWERDDYYTFIVRTAARNYTVRFDGYTEAVI